MKKTLFLFIIVNAVVLIWLFGSEFRQPDTTCYIEGARLITGLGGGVDCSYRLLKPLPLIFSGWLEKLTGIDARYGFFLQNLIFYLLASWLIFEIIRIVFKNERQALLAAIIFATTPPFLIFGLAYLTDLMGWFWGILGIYLTLKFNQKPLFIGLAAGIGFLYKESALMGLIFFGGYTLFDNSILFKKKFELWFLAALGFLLPVLASSLIIYKYFNYTFWSWFQFAWQKPYGNEYDIVHFVQQLAKTFYLYWPLFAVGLIRIIRERQLVITKFTLASGLSLMLWFVWAYPAARIFYLSAPFLVAVASYGALAFGKNIGVFLVILAAAVNHFSTLIVIKQQPLGMALVAGAAYLVIFVFFLIYSSPTRRYFPKEILQKFFLVAISIGLVFLVFELVLRGAGYSGENIQRNAQTGLMTLIPNWRGYFKKDCLENFVQANSSGFHDFEFDKEKGRDVYKIAVLGDSYVEAMHVPLKKSFHNILEEKLNRDLGGYKKFEVYAFGQSGNGTFANYLYLKKHALLYKPDLVINAFLIGNDFRNDSPELSRQGGLTLPAFFPAWDGEGNLNMALTENYLSNKTANAAKLWLKRIASRSAFVIWLYPKYYLAKSKIEKIFKKEGPVAANFSADSLNVDDQVFFKNYPDTWNEIWAVEEKLLSLMKKDARAAGAQFVLISLTEGFRVHPRLMKEKNFSEEQKNRFDFEKPERLLKEISAKHNIIYLPLLPFFREKTRDSDNLTVFSCDGHWNEYGHALAAEAIFSFLKNELLLRPGS